MISRHTESKLKYIQGTNFKRVFSLLRNRLLHQILWEIDKKQCSAYDLSKKLKKDYSQIHREIKKLQRYGLIEEEFEQDSILTMIENQTTLTKKEVMEMVEKKYKEMNNLITKDEAICLVARDLHVITGMKKKIYKLTNLTKNFLKLEKEFINSIANPMLNFFEKNKDLIKNSEINKKEEFEYLILSLLRGVSQLTPGSFSSIQDKISKKMSRLYSEDENKEIANMDYYKLAEQEFGFSVKKAKIMIIGCGGAGQNAVTRLTEAGVEGATTIIINSDKKHLEVGKADKKILIGKELTGGLGCGGYPEIGKKCAEESKNEIKDAMEGCDLAFIIAGMGKGTGTGSAPVICEIAKSIGAIVIAVVTMPFKLEGARIVKAEEGLAALRLVCDTAIVIENDKLLEYAGNVSIQSAFKVLDEMIAGMIKGITETITLPSLVNLDYSDIKSVMQSGGVAAIGFGEAKGKNRVKEAATKALTNPLLEIDYSDSKGALIEIKGGPDLKLDEISTVCETVAAELKFGAKVLWGARILPELEGKIEVIVIITGVKSPYILGPLKNKQDAIREMKKRLGVNIIK